MNDLVESPYVKIRDMISDNVDKDVVLTEVNTLIQVYSDVERKIEAHTKAELYSLAEQESEGRKLVEMDVIQAPSSGSIGVLCGIGTWLLVVFLGSAGGVGSFFMNLIIVGPIIGVVVGVIVSNAESTGAKRVKDDKEYELRREGRGMLEKTDRKEKAIRAEHQMTMDAIKNGRDHVKRNVKKQIKHINQRILDLKLTLDLKADVSVDAHNAETIGKPLISWNSKNLEIDTDALMGETDTQLDVAKLGGAQLIQFYNDGIGFELKVYSNEGGLITEGNYKQQGVLIHHSDIEAKGEFLDQSLPAGATRNYYVVLETNYFLARPTQSDVYELGRHVDEHLIFSKRITVPQFLSEADRLDKEISDNTTQIKREKYREQYQRTLKKISGDSADPDQALKDVLQTAKSRRSMEQKKQEYVTQIEAELAQIGASEEEIEEAIEAFYKSMES